MNGDDRIDLFVCRNVSARPTEELVAECVSQFAEEAYPSEWKMARDEWGKPCFPAHPEVYFSVTHSGEYWMCAMARQPVGLDLQRKTSARRAAISRRFFHPEEDAWLRTNDYRDFFEIWAAKESCVKYIGRGIAFGLQTFSVLSGGGLISQGIDGSCLRRLPFLEGWCLYLCSREASPVHRIEFNQ